MTIVMTAVVTMKTVVTVMAVMAVMTTMVTDISKTDMPCLFRNGGVIEK